MADCIIDICKENSISNQDALFSLAVRYLEQHNLISKPHVRQVIEQTAFKTHEKLLNIPLPENEPDILGFIYQCMLCEGEKNRSGSYYTPQEIASKMLSDFTPAGGKTLFDPCCGSGAFLTAAQNFPPEQLFGCDKDPIAVLIAKVNLLCKFKDIVFAPQIYCCDFLRNKLPLETANMQFDYIAANPPWGAQKNSKQLKSGASDTFSLFFCKAKKMLKENGSLDFLLPQSVLHTKKHRSLRNFILSSCALERITLHNGTFSGVMTKCVDIRIKSSAPSDSFELQNENKSRRIKTEHILQSPDLTFTFANDIDLQILEKLKHLKCFYLKPSMFALGIVTGDNKRFLSDSCQNAMEAVFTGKEISGFVLKKPQKYLHFTPEQFQQTAKLHFYRAPEKLVYKFISKHPVFAYDNGGHLFLNSANIIIPEIPGMSIKTVLGFLNSNFLKYLYCTKFQDIKVLKSNLMQLPFPETDKLVCQKIDLLVNRIIEGDNSCLEELQNIVYSCYGISVDERNYIERFLKKL